MWLNFAVKPHRHGMKLGEFLKSEDISASLIKQVKYTQTGILVDGIRTNTNATVYTGQRVSFFLQEEKSDVMCEPIPLSIVAQNQHFVLLNKPAGMVVHPTFNYNNGTLANAWMAYLAAQGKSGVFRPINRIDKDTSGLVLCAKNSYAAPILAQKAEKTYLAVAVGEMPLRDGKINLPIGRSEGSMIKREISKDGQPSITQYTVLAAANGYTALKLKLLTGRTHQIRVHLSAIGYPLVGDWLYGTANEQLNRQALHCFSMKIPTFGGKAAQEFFAPVPLDMQRLYQRIIGKKHTFWENLKSVENANVF